MSAQQELQVIMSSQFVNVLQRLKVTEPTLGNSVVVPEKSFLQLVQLRAELFDNWVPQCGVGFWQQV